MEMSMFLVALLCACLVTRISAQTYNTMMANYDILLSLYGNNTDLIPIRDLNSTMVVQSEMIIYSLNDFDEVAGSLELSASLKLYWTDDIVDAIYDGFLNNSDIFQLVDSTSPTANTLMVPQNKIWTPKLVIRNSINSFSAIGNDAYKCRYNLTNGNVEWQPRILIKSACSPDVTYYPFDRQSCSFSFVSWGFTSRELKLSSLSSQWDISSYEDDGVWEFTETAIQNVDEDNQSVLKMTFTLQRKPLYFAFNFIIPVLLLCILNGMVFLLPANSGERVGFSVTCFLSFMVLLNTIMDILPRSSTPMSYLCYYLVVMMIFSGMETALVVLQMRIFHKPDTEKVPRFIRTILSYWQCCSCQSKSHFCCGKGPHTPHKHRGHVKRVSVEPIVTVESKPPHAPEAHESKRAHFTDDNSIHADDESPITRRLSENGDRKMDIMTHEHLAGYKIENNGEHDDKCKMAEVTWQDVARFLDIILFFTFFGVEVFFSATFLLPLGYRA